MSQARRTWEVAYRAVITSLQLLDDYRTIMGIENGSGRSHVNRQIIIDFSCCLHYVDNNTHLTISAFNDLIVLSCKDKGSS